MVVYCAAEKSPPATSFLHFFFFNDTATTEIYTLSLHDALPISSSCNETSTTPPPIIYSRPSTPSPDRKSTRLNSSHANISYAVFCLKKKKKKKFLILFKKKQKKKKIEQ